MTKYKNIIIKILLSTFIFACILWPNVNVHAVNVHAVNVHASEPTQSASIQRKMRKDLLLEPFAIGDLTMSIYAAINTKSSSSGVSGLGNSHAWVVIKNTGKSKSIGGYTLPHNASVTIGSWGNTSPTGIWFNQERKKINQFQNNNNTVYKKILVTESEVSAINNVLSRYGNWTLNNNCTHLATNLWNAVGGNFSPSLTPGSLREKIIHSGYYQTGTTDVDFISASSTPKLY